MRGRFTVYVDTSDVSRQIDHLDRTVTDNVRRLVIALLLVGLIIGAGIAVSAAATLNSTLHTIAYIIFLSASLAASAIVIRAFWRWLDRGEF